MNETLGSFSSRSIAYCLEQAGSTSDQVDHIATNRYFKAQILRKIGFVLQNAH
jgi:hypothetical protein